MHDVTDLHPSVIESDQQRSITIAGHNRLVRLSKSRYWIRPGNGMN